MSAGEAARAEVSAAMLGMTVITGAGAAVGTATLACHVVSLRENARLLHQQPTLNRWRVYMLVMMGAFVTCMVLVGVMVWKRWDPGNPGDVQMCLDIPGWVACFFVLMKQAEGLVLYSRAVIVHNALKLDLKRLQWFMYFNVTAGVWLVFGWSIWSNYRGKILSPEGGCVFYSENPWIILSFALLDAVLQVGMLMMFVLPMSSHLREMGGGGGGGGVTSKVTRTMRVNFVLSLLITLCDIAALGVLTGLLVRVNGVVVDRAEEYLQMVALAVPLCENFLGALALHTLTKAWIPRALRAQLVRSEVGVATVHTAFLGNDGPGAAPNSHAPVFVGDTREPAEVRLTVKKFQVPHDTPVQRLVGLGQALTAWTMSSSSALRVAHVLIVWGLHALSVLVLLDVIPRWVSFLVLIPVMIAVFVVNNFHSIVTLKATLKDWNVRLRLLVATLWCGLLCDVVPDERIGVVLALYVEVCLTFVQDALVEAVRKPFLTASMIMALTIPLALLVLLYGDFIAARHNTILNMHGGFQLSVYHAAAGCTIYLASLMARDTYKVVMGHKDKYLTFLNGDLGVKVVGLRGILQRQQQQQQQQQQQRSPPPPSSVSSGTTTPAGKPPEGGSGGEATPTNNEDMPAFIPTTYIKGWGYLAMRFIRGEAGDSSNMDTNDTVRAIVLSEEESLVVQLLGVQRGDWLLGVFVQPRFRLLMELCQAVPFVLYILYMSGLLPGGISYLMLLVLVPFARNQGMKSLPLLRLLLLRADVILDAAAAFAAFAFLGVSLSRGGVPEAGLLTLYLACWWFDLQTQDARTVFLHTGTRRGKRLSPMEKLVFRVAGSINGLSFLAMPLLGVAGVWSGADFSAKWVFRSDPNSLAYVPLYETGVELTLLLSYWLLANVYRDLFTRGRGVFLRNLRAPLQPVYVAQAQLSDGGKENADVLGANRSAKGSSSDSHDTAAAHGSTLGLPQPQPQPQQPGVGGAAVVVVVVEHAG